MCANNVLFLLHYPFFGNDVTRERKKRKGGVHETERWHFVHKKETRRKEERRRLLKKKKKGSSMKMGS